MSSIPFPPGLGPIQVIPPGLTGLLQIKQLGKNPSTLDSNVGGVLELRDWFMQARRLNTTSLFTGIPLTAALVTGNTNFQPFKFGGVNVAVPQGQIWYVEMLTVSASIGTAADSISMSPALENPTPIEVYVVGNLYSDVVNARARVAQCKADRGFWAQAGDVFGVMVTDIVSVGGITAVLTMRATPMQI